MRTLDKIDLKKIYNALKKSEKEFAPILFKRFLENLSNTDDKRLHLIDRENTVKENEKSIDLILKNYYVEPEKIEYLEFCYCMRNLDLEGSFYKNVESEFLPEKSFFSIFTDFIKEHHKLSKVGPHELTLLTGYVAGLKLGFIDPNATEEDQLIFKQFCKMFYLVSPFYKPKEKSYDDFLIYVCNSPHISEEEKKYHFCQYLEMKVVIPQQKEMQEIKNYFQDKDFTQYYKEFKKIKNYFKDNESEIVVTTFKVKQVKYNFVKISQRCNDNTTDDDEKLDAEDIGKHLELIQNYIENKIQEQCKEIVSVKFLIEENDGEILVIYKQDSPTIENTIVYMNQTIEYSLNYFVYHNAINVDNCNKYWNNISLYQQLDNDLSEKKEKKTPKKKI